MRSPTDEDAQMPDIKFLLKPRYANSRALVIGINEYKNASPLSYAVSDAEAIRELLISDFAFPRDNITYLVDSEATKSSILKSFLKFAAEDVEIDDRVIVFFAGHGHTRTSIRREVGYLIPHDADMNDLSTLIRWDELTQNAELIRAKHMLFIMDACYGGLALTRSLQPGSVRFLRDMMLRYSRQVLTAGKANEVVADSGGPLPNHSIFTGHLIEGLRGNAATEQGVVTAAGLMAYVYNKVASDKNSNQTPHYGHFDGDGDFIITAPNLFAQNESADKDIDELLAVPAIEGEHSTQSTLSKITKVKRLLSDDSSTIELHDFMVEEVRHFLSQSSEDNFKVAGQFSAEELLQRISKYEGIAFDLCMLLATISYWAKPTHKQILQKILARSADRLENKSGLSVWLSLRWYPLLLEMYCAGIAAVAAQHYDSLANVFYTRIESFEHNKEQHFVESVTDAMIEWKRSAVFNQIPGHDRYHAPVSEYLFKLLQPKLDDTLFIGKEYENAFDEFEILLALVVADIEKQKGSAHWSVWGSIGRLCPNLKIRSRRGVMVCCIKWK